jgi:hypothetical protein
MLGLRPDDLDIDTERLRHPLHGASTQQPLHAGENENRMNTPDGYTNWDSFAREKYDAARWVERHQEDYPMTKEERIREEFTPEQDENQDSETDP